MLSHADNEEDRPAASPPSAPLNSPPAGPRAQRLSPEETAAVVALWQQERVEQTGVTDRPAVPDVAEGLDLSVAEVQRLLAEVRARREAESRLLAHEQELAEIRLAEEERKLAEIQRQRAELRREQAYRRERHDQPSHDQPAWPELPPRPCSLPPSLPPERPLLDRLPENVGPVWEGVRTFSLEERAAEALAEGLTEEARDRRADRAFWGLMMFILLVTLGGFFWALAVQH